MPETETTTEAVAEETTTEAVETEATETDQPEPEPATEETSLGAGGRKAIESEREARKTAERELREARAALKEYEDRDKSELELLRERAEEAEKRAAEAELERLRTKVAAEKRVPASRLIGSTEEEMMAAADELLAWRDETAPPPPPKPLPVSGGLKSGASGAENTSPDLKVRAAEGLRRLRSSG